MNKVVTIVAVLLVGFSPLSAQEVLPGYDGVWAKWEADVNVIDFVAYYPSRLGYLRNEIFARYGRAFTTPAYQDYFSATSWYRTRDDYRDSWPSRQDMRNANLIFSVERPARSREQVVDQILDRIEYSSDDAVLTFTSETQVIWIDPRVNFGMYALNGNSEQMLSWVYFGDWILVYEEDRFEGYQVIAYELDHSSGRIVDSAFRFNQRISRDEIRRLEALR